MKSHLVVLSRQINSGVLGSVAVGRTFFTGNIRNGLKQYGMKWYEGGTVHDLCDSHDQSLYVHTCYGFATGIAARLRKALSQLDVDFLKNDAFSLLIGQIQLKLKRANKNHSFVVLYFSCLV